MSNRQKPPKMPTSKEEWKKAFADAVQLLHTESELSTPDLHEVLDYIEDEVDRVRSVEFMLTPDDEG